MKKRQSVRTTLIHVVPWIITVIALFFAFRGIDFSTLLSHLHESQPAWLVAGFVLTIFSYLLRSLRWQRLFPEHTLEFPNAARVLFLGFFMNNILPARAGEFVRAHMGARISRQTRTLVLATIASERLVDGLTISFLFVLFGFGMGDSGIGKNLAIVAGVFAVVGCLVVMLLFCRSRVLALAQALVRRYQHSASSYALSRIEAFLHGLSPLSSPYRLMVIGAWSLAIWLVEVGVYFSIGQAFSASLTFAQATLFLVAVNFASLIPSAPGAIGVIEAVASAVLVSIGFEREHALTMTIAQHATQYLVVGIPGAIVMINWRKTLEQVRAQYESESDVPAPASEAEAINDAAVQGIQKNSGT